MSTDLDDRPWPFPTGRIEFAPAGGSCAEPAIDPEKLRVILVGPEPLIEALTWHDVAAGDMPDADADVLLWILDADGAKGWDRGWWDVDCWRLAESGARCDGTVLFWSSPEGPAA